MKCCRIHNVVNTFVYMICCRIHIIVILFFCIWLVTESILLSTHLFIYDLWLNPYSCFFIVLYTTCDLIHIVVILFLFIYYLWPDSYCCYSIFLYITCNLIHIIVNTFVYLWRVSGSILLLFYFCMHALSLYPSCC